MKKLKIKESHLIEFERIIDTYKTISKYPEQGRWKNLSNNEIWFWMVGQIMVVGSSGGAKRFWKNESLKKQIEFDSLKYKKNDAEIGKAIHNVLRKVGARYASVDIDKCTKTKALVHNYKFVSAFKNGFKEVFEELELMNGEGHEIKRVYYLMEHLKFFKNKSARDFLMNLGMNQNTIAIDIRTQNIFQHFKIAFPAQQAFGSRDIYESIEQDIVSKICQPLKISPLHFDRILYQNYFKILKDDYLQLKLGFV